MSDDNLDPPIDLDNLYEALVSTEGLTIEEVAETIRQRAALESYLREWLEERHLYWPKVVELMYESDQASDLDDPRFVRAVRYLWLHGCDDEQIGHLLSHHPYDIIQLRTGKYQLGGRAWSETGQRIVALHYEGKTAREMRAEGIPSRQIENIYAELGWKTNVKQARDRWSDERIDELCRRYRDGETIAEIACAMGTQSHTVGNNLRAAHKKGLLPEYGTRMREVVPC